MTLKLGVIGLSEGNGHPYSWSAICNGYKAKEMELCGFPVIPRYLERQNWPSAQLSGARVTHIWTQDKLLSQKIAIATNIGCVVSTLEEMVDCVDGVLLARDDAENHLAMARPFLEAGLPVYIDKPICHSLEELNRLYSFQRYPGQIFSCSATRYAAEFRLCDSEREALGKLMHIHAMVPKDWARYAVHVIEPLLQLVGDCGRLTFHNRWNHGECCVNQYAWDSGFQATVSTMGAVSCPLSLRVVGDKGWQDLMFVDTFSAFKGALEDFVAGVIARDERTDRQFMHRVVEMIQLGRGL